MVKFEFTLSDEDAENLFQCIASAKANTGYLIGKEMAKGADADKISALWKTREYLEELHAKLLHAKLLHERVDEDAHCRSQIENARIGFMILGNMVTHERPTWSVVASWCKLTNITIPATKDAMAWLKRASYVERSGTVEFAITVSGRKAYMEYARDAHQMQVRLLAGE